MVVVTTAVAAGGGGGDGGGGCGGLPLLEQYSKLLKGDVGD